MKRYTELELIEGIRKGDGEIIRFVMKNHMESIKVMINNLKLGRYVQSEDIIQDGMVELILKVRENRFKGNSSISTYFYSICKNICLKHYRRFKNIYLSTQEIDINEEVQDEEDDEKILKVIEILRHMKKECIEIIDLRFGLFTENQITEGSVVNKRFIEIAKILNLEYANVRQRFIRCIQALLAKYRKKETALYN